MKRLLVIAALTATTIASPAFAQDGRIYAGAEGGALFVKDTVYDIGAGNNQASADHERGYDLGGFAGYDFGSFRLEAEASYRGGGLNSFTSSIPIPMNVPTPGTYPLEGHERSRSLMVNGMVDFGNDNGIQGFVGGGLGVARTDLSFTINTNFLNDSDSGFAYQAFAGVRMPISRNLDVGLKYTYFTHPNIHLTAGSGAPLESRFRTQSVQATLTYNFGKR